MSLNFQFLKKNLIDISIFIILQYVLTTVILILLYSGGNPINPTEHFYVFNLNYLSDLGRVSYFSQQANPFWVFYALSMLLIGIGVFLYFYLLSRLITNLKIRKIIIFLSVITGLSYALISFFKIDTNLNGHIIAAMVSFYTFIFANLMINLFIKKELYPYIFYATALLNFFLISRMLILIFLNYFHIEPTELLKVRVISQKIIVYMQVIIMTSILFYIKRMKIFCYEN